MNNYFSHDSNARNSDRLLPVRIRYGAEGYGIYFMLLERLREEPEYMSVKDYNMLAFDLRVDTGKLKSIVEDFGLFTFTDNGECFYSKGFKKRMELKDKKSSKLSEAGKRGAEKRWGSNEGVAKPKPSYSHPIANAIENDSKKRKEKESKGNKSKAVDNAQEKKDGEISKEKPAATAYKFWEENVAITGLSEFDRELLKDLISLGGNELTVHAMKKAIELNRRRMKTVDTVLRGWLDNGVKTTAEADEHEKNWNGGANNNARAEPAKETVKISDKYNFGAPRTN
ncbi:DnaD domain protein [Listeria monocytogenes]|nr:DnaD domain protein [Listeria monocytogenes]